MLGVTVSEVCNAEDKKPLRLHVEWIDAHFKIVLLSSTMEVLCGEMNAENVNDYSKELSKSCKDYLNDTQQAFLGNDPEVTFLLKNETFTWKRGIWMQGKIQLNQISDIKTLAHIYGELLVLHKATQEGLKEVDLRNDLLQKCNDKLKRELEELIKMKQTLEKQLYQKFILLLNSKKERIRELESSLNSGRNEEKSIFDRDTEESDISDKEEKPLVIKDVLKSEKRKFLCEDIETDTGKIKKSNIQTTFKAENDSRSEASTSKGLTNEYVEPRPTSDSSETDYELVLKDVDNDDTSKISVRRLSFSEEPEEDLFAQT